MMSGSTRHPLRRGVRRFLLGSGPLKRSSDRLQMAGRLVVLLALLAAVPLAVIATGIARGRLEAMAVAQAADRQEIRAVVIRSTAIPAGDGGTAAFSLKQAEVSWHGPRGSVRRATLLVPAGTPVGSTVPVWIDQRGQLTSAPVDRSTIGDNALTLGLTAAVGVPLALWALHCGLCIALDAHRTRRWGEDWARVEREWRARSG